MATWLRTDGSHETVTPRDGVSFALDELHHYVGGYIEIVAAPADREGRTSYFVINEDGKGQGLSINWFATIGFHLAGGDVHDVIVGNVLVVRRDELGETDDADDE